MSEPKIEVETDDGVAPAWIHLPDKRAARSSRELERDVQLDAPAAKAWAVLGERFSDTADVPG